MVVKKIAASPILPAQSHPVLKDILHVKEKKKDLKGQQDADQIIELMKQKEKQKKSIDNQIKKIKDDNDLKDITDTIKDCKTVLYEFLVENDIDEYRGVSLAKILPASEKKKISENKKTKKVFDILMSGLNDDDVQIDSLARNIVDEI